MIPGTAAPAADPWATALPGSYAAGTAGAILGANLDAKVSSRSTFAGGAVAGVTAPVTVGTNNDKAGYTLAAAGLDAIPVEAGVNARQALSPILAASAGVLIGAGTGTIVIKGGNTALTRITATTDNAGNRTASSSRSRPEPEASRCHRPPSVSSPRRYYSPYYFPSLVDAAAVVPRPAPGAPRPVPRPGRLRARSSRP